LVFDLKGCSYSRRFKSRLQKPYFKVRLMKDPNQSRFKKGWLICRVTIAPESTIIFVEERGEGSIWRSGLPRHIDTI
jgi:nitroreductase